MHGENKPNAKFNTSKMMAKQIYILGYVIAIILILSNVKNVSSNKNNQYATSSSTTTATSAYTAALDGTDDPVAVSSTKQFHTSTNTHTSAANAYPMSKMVTVQSAVETKSISALHGRATDFMQQTLHNTSSTIDEEPSMQQPHDQKEVRKQVERPQIDNNNNNSNHSNNNNNNNGKIDNNNNEQSKYLVQSDAENPKQLLSTLSMHDLQPKPSEKWHNHAQVTQHNERLATATEEMLTPLSQHDKFMNENRKTPSAIESNTGITMVSPSATATTAASVATATEKTIASDEIRNAQLTKHAHPLERINGESDNNDDSRKSDEITAVPVKMLRDNVNATSDAVFRVVNKTFTNDSDNFNSDSMMNARRADATPDMDDSFAIEPFNERSRYLETDLDELSESNFDQTDVNANDQLDWSSDANSFEELTLNDEDSAFGGDDDVRKSVVKMQARSWKDNESPGVVGSPESISMSTIATPAPQNILKISKPNKSKSMKRLAAAPPPPTPQALLEIRLSKSVPTSPTYDKQFINPYSFRYMTDLYDQYEWDADELQMVLTKKCANDMDVYLDALVQGRTWAAKGN